MIQGKSIYNFGIPERLRTLRYSIFTGGVVEENGNCRAAFCESAVLRVGSWLALSVTAYAVPHSPFCRCATSSPGAGEVFPQRERLWRNRKLCRYAKGSPFGRAGKPDRA